VIEGKLIGVVIFGNGAGATFYDCDISAALGN
jgi:3-hydroxy-3-methylglutaryl CoA synthase